MRIRGRDLNWFDLTRDALAFHESDFCRGMQERKVALGCKSGMGRLDGSMLYSLVRWIKPKTVLELGTYFGLSTTYILKAMEDNGGESALVTVDYHKDPYVGSIIPDDLRRRYTQVFGDHREIGAKLPARPDFILHDASHRLPNQRHEIPFYWERLAPGGLLAVHDVDMCAAFVEFLATTYRHDEGGMAADATTHSFWSRISSLGWAQKT